MDCVKTHFWNVLNHIWLQLLLEGDEANEWINILKHLDKGMVPQASLIFEDFEDHVKNLLGDNKRLLNENNPEEKIISIILFA